MNKAVFIFMLIIVSAFNIFAQTDQNNIPNDQNNNNGDIYPKLETMEKQIFDLYKKIENLQTEVSILKSGPSIQNDSPYNATPKINIQQITGKGYILIFILFLIVIVLISICIFFLKNKKHDIERKPAGNAWKESENLRPKATMVSRRTNPSSSPSVPPSPPRSTPVYPGQGQSANPLTTAASSIDELSILFRSSDERNKRTNNAPSDVFLDIPRSVYERMFQGENVQQLVLEKRGSRSTAMFVLVKNKELYPNFYSFNETNQLPKENEKILTMIYDFDKNNLPGYIKTCSPATVSISGDGSYKISIKGKLILINRA